MRTNGLIFAGLIVSCSFLVRAEAAISQASGCPSLDAHRTELEALGDEVDLARARLRAVSQPGLLMDPTPACNLFTAENIALEAMLRVAEACPDTSEQGSRKTESELARRLLLVREQFRLFRCHPDGAAVDR